jgi:hypothetical protein
MRLDRRTRRAVFWLAASAAGYYGVMTVGHVLGLVVLLGRALGG